ncbi:MAG: hypothetical protein M1828_001623 [Chrysothrix sp. TS-e1954]|nr:MAG: hypothetical protein M1828_001623 [Chrysothrix sp. TS-e1954]
MIPSSRWNADYDTPYLIYEEREAVSLRAGKTFLTVLTIGALTAGFSLSALVAFACDSRLFRSEAVYIPCLSSCSLGIVIVLVSFAISGRYEWDIGSILGTSVGVASTLIFGGLLLHIQYSLSKYRARSLDQDRQPLTKARSIVEDRGESAWSDAPRSRSPATEEPTSYTWNNAVGPVYPQNTLQNGSAYANSDVTCTGNVNGPLPAGSLYADYDRSPEAQLAPTETAQPEEEETRQQMMKLLLQQTSEQWKSNPNRSTFKIELPEHMRQALQRDGVDSGEQLLSASSPAPSSSTAGRSRDQTPVSAGSLYDWRDGKQRTGRRRNFVPMPPIPMSDRSKSREDRRKEIELGYTSNG